MPSKFDVAVVIPVHGDGKYLQESINSCFNNSGPSFQVILVLDRATKKVTDILNPLQEEHSNLKILVSEEPGISAALNLGVAEADSDLIARLDSDDVMSSQRLENQVSFMKRNPQIEVCGSQVIHIDEESRPFRESHYPQTPREISKRLKYTNALAHSSVTLRRQSIILAGGYRSQFDGAEDYDLWLRIDNKENIINLSSYLTSFREHPHQSAQNSPEFSLILASKIRLEKLEITEELRLEIESAQDFRTYLAAIKLARTRSKGSVRRSLSDELVRLKYSMLHRTGRQERLVRSLLTFLKVSLVCIRYDWRQMFRISVNVFTNYSRTQLAGLSRTLILGRKFER